MQGWQLLAAAARTGRKHTVHLRDNNEGDHRRTRLIRPGLSRIAHGTLGRIRSLESPFDDPEGADVLAGLLNEEGSSTESRSTGGLAGWMENTHLGSTVDK